MREPEPQPTGAPTRAEPASAGSRWSLARAVDALGEAVRAAGRPGWIWLAGIAYPGFNLGLEAARQLLVLGAGERLVPGPGTLFHSDSAVLALMLAPLVCRVTAGLARLAPPAAWERAAGPHATPQLRAAWRAGRGLTLGTLGLWLLLGMLYAAVGLAATLLALGVGEAARGADDLDLARIGAALVLAPAVTLLALYAAVVSVLHQLSLHSLAHNRRGVGSALVHAWRIARHDPGATARAVCVDAVLQVGVGALWMGLYFVLALTGLPLLLALVGVALAGYLGVARAGFWARAYRELGGLSPDDGVPGLVGESGGAAARDAGGREERGGW